ncbi:MAG: hypothetical protein CMH83_12315 [Nocardioides sp.]|nr:hypothetical protein [Nocardioides sp.]
MTDDVTDDERDLRALLHAADPASTLPPLGGRQIDRMVEETMTDDTDTQPVPARSRRLTWLVAAAAAVVILAVVGGFALTGGTDQVDSAGDTPGEVVDSVAEDPSADAGEEADAPTVTELSVGDTGTAGRCLPPDRAPQVIAGQDVVVDAVVESISGSTVTLRPTRWFSGEETDLVTVQAPDEQLQQLLVAVDFAEDERYLVAATEGQVTLCGFTAPWTPELEQVYETAFDAAG